MSDETFDNPQCVDRSCVRFGEEMEIHSVRFVSIKLFIEVYECPSCEMLRILNREAKI